MVSVIIVGIDGWKEWTQPAVVSIKDRLNIVVIDNGSKTPYPEYNIVYRLDKTVSYTKAINYGIKCAGESDWYLVLNNDIVFNAPVLPIIDKLDDSFLYGRQIIEGHGYRWLGLWLALISNKVWKTVGEFDENFQVCGFDDADYCIRAKHLGIDTLYVPLDIHHFGSKTITKMPSYKSSRQNNIEYFQKKHGFRPDEYKVICN
jgi:GT2 family glycosyltransferase